MKELPFYRKLKLHLLWLLSISFCLLYSCANIVTPSGGKKDTTPPKVVKASPPGFSKEFTAKKIVITFNEYFSLNDPANQVYMSPITNKKPKVSIKKKNLVITLPDSLKANTTYCINFGNSLADLNEGNKLTDFKYIFSTGDHIDSLKINGKVENAFDKKTEKDILVMLFDDLSDSAVSKKRPLYYSRTDENGHYKIDYIAEGRYRLFCLKDQNFNYRYDLPNEEIAFLDTLIYIKDTISHYNLELFQPPVLKQKRLYASSKDYGRIVIALAKPVETFSILPDKKNVHVVATQLSATKDTVTAWVDDVHSDSLYFTLKDNNFLDTLGVEMKQLPKDSSLARRSRMVYHSNFSGTKPKFIIPTNTPIQFTFNRPIKSVNANRTITITDSAKKFVPVTTNLKVDSITGKKTFYISFASKENIKYKLKIQDSVFYDVFGLTNDSITIPFKTTSEQDVGTLTFDILQKDSTADYYVQLFLKGGSVIESRKLMPGKNVIKFGALLPGAYAFRAVKDDNHNGKWDGGDYWKKIQPEKVIIFPGDINIRANWDVEQNMTIK